MNPCSPRSNPRGRLEPFVPLPENRAALHAVHYTVAGLARPEPRSPFAPLFLHGPTGTGKSLLVQLLVQELLYQVPDRTVQVLTGYDLALRLRPRLENPEDEVAELEAARDCDLLVLEDLQHLPARSAETIVQLLDHRRSRRRATVVTAHVGPGQLDNLPTRLTSRLAAGLVVAVEAPSVASRLTLLQQKAQRRQLAVPAAVLAWVAEHLPGGGRALDGAVLRLETLARQQSRPLDVETVAGQLHDLTEAGRPSLDRIAQRVGRHYQATPRDLQSRRRNQQVLLPRQVAMYLARQLTTLSLQQIGAWFGGRDHTTVLHACQKVEQALGHDAVLSGVVKQLHADLA